MSGQFRPRSTELTLHRRGVVMKLRLPLVRGSGSSPEGENEKKKNRGKNPVQRSSSDTTTNMLCDPGQVSSSLGLWSPELQNALN